MLTGNLQADYAITYTVQTLYALTRWSVRVFHQCLIDYPDISLMFLSVLGVIVAYYLLKNLVRIVYSVIVNTLKLLVFLSLLFVGVWIYVRGLEMFTKDFKYLMDFTSNYNASELPQDVKKYSSSLTMLYRWVTEQADN